MPNIEAVFFDQGNVLDSYDAANRAVAERLRIPQEDFSRIVKPYVPKFHRGMSEMDFLGRVCRNAGVDVPKSPIYLDIYEALRTLNTDLLGVAAQLKERGIKTGIISNAEPPLRDFLERKYQHYPGLFDVIMLSCVEGCAKPESEFFYRALKVLNVRPENAVFVDDVEDYVRAFEALNGKGVHHINNQRTIRELSELVSHELVLGRYGTRSL